MNEVTQMLSRIRALQSSLNAIAEQVRVFGEDAAALKAAMDPALSELAKLKQLEDAQTALAAERANVAKLAADLSAKIAKAQRVHDLMQAAE
jgi:hypothetical protein